MPACPEVDDLVTLAHLRDDVPALLAHLTECDSCGEQLAGLAILKRGLEGEVAARAGFTESVMAALPLEATPESTRRSRDRAHGAWLWSIAQAALAGIAGIFATGAAAAAAPGAMAPSVFMPAALAAAAILVLPRVRPSRDFR